MAVEVVLNYEGVGELLRSEWAMDCCREAAEEVALSAGDGYEVSTYVGKSRVNASVGAVTPEAHRDNLENNTLLKALGR